MKLQQKSSGESSGSVNEHTSSGNLKPFITSEEIQARIKVLAAQISRDYAGKIPVFIGVLNGSFIFISDLVREVSVDVEIDFLKLSSYGDSKISSGEVKLLKDLNCQIDGRDIIIVEDIVDSGLSIKYIRDLVLSHNPSSLEFCTLLMKKGLSNLSFDIKYTGFEIENKFVVGYGLDYAQKYRNLKEICILES
ncbi:MAG TPA: hypoxanthine phosphoribosyltransferase [Ignavibacteria bacterium]|nr:hypoxanthine phosphoribosyltransferase [Ignavibacteria bacterium]